MINETRFNRKNSEEGVDSDDDDENQTPRHLRKRKRDSVLDSDDD